MSPWDNRLKNVFLAALERAQGAERDAFLDEECGDDEALRYRVVALLEAHALAGRFLTNRGFSPEARGMPPGASESTIWGPPRAEAAARPAPDVGHGPVDDRIGPYRIIRRIGEGGMGIVYLAEQEHAVRRRVALKIIRPALDTAMFEARFEAERQALALMDHPNIARVLDAGATHSGRLFFVMELVEGIPITQFCDEAMLTVRQRLELFLTVCGAVHHAHQKGIIHRDVKPSNILVTRVDDIPTPKVIDFGVAKAIEQRLTDRTLLTQFGVVIGTLEYMSPEQADFGSRDIDTRSDVYSLGVLLYELLTGSTPLDRERLGQSSYSDIVRSIRDEEPAWPSVRLADPAGDSCTISTRRRTEPARLAQLIRGDLDWICMKALEKQRSRRYESAAALARDIERHLADEPVEAHPTSWTYRLIKAGRQHRVELAAVAMAAMVLIAATVVSLVLLYRAEHDRQRARSAEKAARAAESVAIVERSRAQDRERMAINAIRQFGDAIAGTPELKSRPELENLRTRLLREPIEFFKRLRERFQAEGESSPESLDTLADISSNLAYLTNDIGDPRQAVQEYAIARQFREQLAREHPSIVGYRAALGRVCVHMGYVQRQLGRTSDALASCGRALEVQERLARETPSDRGIHDDLATTDFVLAGLQADMGQAAEATASFERALAIRERLVAEDPTTPRFRRELARMRTTLGVRRMQRGDHAGAIAALEGSRGLLEGLLAEHWESKDCRNALANLDMFIGDERRNSGQRAEALTCYERCLDFHRQATRESPSITGRWYNLASILARIGGVRHELGQVTESLAAYDEARSVLEGLVRKYPGWTEYAVDLSLCLDEIAGIDLDRHRFEEAHDALLQAVNYQRQAIASQPNNPSYRHNLRDRLGHLVEAAEALGRADEAATARRELDRLAVGASVR